MNLILTKDGSPDVARKIVAFYDDGSGALLLYRTDSGYIESDGAEWDDDFLAAHCDRWAYLPDDFAFNCETRAEEAYTLPTPAHLAVRDAALQAAEGSDPEVVGEATPQRLAPGGIRNGSR